MSQGGHNGCLSIPAVRGGVRVRQLVLLGRRRAVAVTPIRATRPVPSLQMYAFSSSPAEDAALNTAIADYNKHGRNTVKLNILPEYDTALQTALAGGSPPDVFYVNDNKLPDLAKAGALEPIGDKVDNPGDFYDSLRQSFTYQGTYYCPPKDFSTLQLVYNTDELAAAGVKPPTTWQELTDAAQKLTKPGRPALVINPEFYRWGVFMAQAGAWPTNNDVTQMTMDSAQMKQALQYVADMHKAGTAASAAKVGAGWGGEALGKGKAAMTIEGNWIVGAMKTDFPTLKYAVAELPAGPAGKATMAFSVCYGVAKASKNKAAAIDFVKFLTSPRAAVGVHQGLPGDAVAQVAGRRVAGGQARAEGVRRRRGVRQEGRVHPGVRRGGGHDERRHPGPCRR